MKKLFYATKNKFKIQNMQDRLKGLEIELVTSYDLEIDIDIEESGTTVIDNAILKAKAYFDVVQIPTIAGDSSLYVEKFKEQPGLQVRRKDGKYLEDDELECYYIKKLNEVGGQSKALYVTGLALITDEGIKTKQIKEDEFLLTSRVCEKPRNSDALGRLEYDENLNKYFCEMNEKDKKVRGYKFDKECTKFILDNL